MMISKDEFRRYEEVRSNGMVNMFDVVTVCDLTGLEKDQIYYIMDNYTNLYERYE